jgi:probable HAF family extracellular repeat protein
LKSKPHAQTTGRSLSSFLLCLAAAFLSLTTLSLTLRPAAAANYTITNLNALGNFNYAYGMNANASAVGLAGYYVGASAGTLRTTAGTTNIANPPGHTANMATAVNSANLVVGHSWSSQDFRGYTYTYQNGTLSALPALTYAVAVNDAGHIAGTHGGSPAVYRNGVTTLLTTLAGGANSINSLGSVVGRANSRPFLYQGSTFTDFGLPSGHSSGAATDINDAGTIVGYASGQDPLQSPSNFTHAFLYSAGAFTLLPTFGGRFTIAEALNNAGSIVGSSYTRLDAAQNAYIYENGVMTDLNTLIPPGSGWRLTRAIDINGNGEIVGNGVFGGVASAFLLTPIPEPALAPLLSISLLLHRRRRSRSCVRSPRPSTGAP